MSLPSFRSIRPSTVGGSSASTSNPSQSTTESTGSESRRLRGEKDVESNSSASKRRRAPESVTRNACLNCKKARAKCDGKKPCHRCSTRIETSECIYEIHIKHAKEELVKQIKDLRAKDHLTGQILQALSADENVPEILDRLRNEDSYSNIVEWLGRSAVEEPETVSPKGSQFSTFDASDHEMGGVSPTIATSGWSSVRSDSEGRFVDCYNRQSEDYCSSLLVNAICAMACHLHPVGENDDTDFEQLGLEFSEAVSQNIDSSDKAITTTQTLAVMFLLNTARANGLRATSYLKLATSNLANVAYQDSEGFTKVVRYTIRGVRNLNIEWTQLTFQAPPAFFPPRYDDREDVDDESDDAPWFFYRYSTDEPPAWRSLLNTTNREKSKLIDIIQDVTATTYNPQGPKISARLVLQQYSRLTAWREELPSSIRNIGDNGAEALPHVLSLLILYSSSVVQLLRPLLELQDLLSGGIEEAIWHHAQQGLGLLDEHYQATYSCRFQPVLQSFAVLHLADVIARFFPAGLDGGKSKDGPGAIQFAMECLKESRLGFPVAGPLQEMLRKTANECAIRLPNNIGELMLQPGSRPPVYRMDDCLAACTRPTYTQPIDEIHLRYLSSFSSDWTREAAAFQFPKPSTGARRLRVSSAEERGAQSLMQISNLLNVG